MRRVIHSLVLTSLLAVPLAAVSAQKPSAEDIRQLDDQVQDVKTDALEIATELAILENRLLYPSETRLTIFLAMARNEGVQLRTTEVRVDGDLVAQHVYGAGEVEALQKGGMQNLYTGNVTLGSHELSVRLIGQFPNGASFDESGTYEFTKTVDAKTLDVTLDLAAREVGGIRIEDR